MTCLCVCELCFRPSFYVCSDGSVFSSLTQDEHYRSHYTATLSHGNKASPRSNPFFPPSLSVPATVTPQDDGVSSSLQQTARGPAYLF